MIAPEFDFTFEGFKGVARSLIAHGVSPEEVLWDPRERELFQTSFRANDTDTELRVPKEFGEMAKNIVMARVEDKWGLLYRILYRLLNEERDLLKDAGDPDVCRARDLVKSVSKDIHKMHAFVRFKKVAGKKTGEEKFVAWHRPEHLILRAAAPFFEKRFGDVQWAIHTTDESAFWNLKELSFGPGMDYKDFKVTDEFDEAWKDYYRSIYNPARINLKMMKQEMSPKYWQSLPEAQVIKDLVEKTPELLKDMEAAKWTEAMVDKNWTLKEMELASQSCKACPLYKDSSQTTFGEGAESASLMLVGEAPGEQDVTGALLDEVLEGSGLLREEIYLTSAVKHLKHKSPTGRETQACRPWLEAQIAKVSPKVIVAMGAVAATSILGRRPVISKERGKVLRRPDCQVVVTWELSAILRARSDEVRKRMVHEILNDLSLARDLASL